MSQANPAARQRAIEAAEAARARVVSDMRGYLDDLIDQLNTAVANGDVAIAERLAHDMSGEAELFGAPVVASLAKSARAIIVAPPSSKKEQALRATAHAIRAAFHENLRPDGDRARELHGQMTALKSFLGVAGDNL